MITILLMPFAVWRITSLLVFEEGPFGILDAFRHEIGIRYDEHSNKYGKNVVADAFSCFWCASIWIGFFWAGMYLLFPEATLWIELPFATSAAAILIDGLMNYGKS